jgi:hypothetical protein
VERADLTGLRVLHRRRCEHALEGEVVAVGAWRLDHAGRQELRVLRQARHRAVPGDLAVRAGDPHVGGVAVAEQVQPGAVDRQRVVDPELVGLHRCLGSPAFGVQAMSASKVSARPSSV